MMEDVSQPAESYDPKKALKSALWGDALEKASCFTNLMFAWVGESRSPSDEEISRYHRFLQDRDVLDLWAENINRPLCRQDLGSLMDLNLIYAFSSPPKDRVTRILEVGGGYGRLAEAAFNVFGSSVQYVLIDAVPASLYYAKKYLSYACPDARIGSYYDDAEDFDLNRYDIAIVPAWHFDKVNTLRYDVCVNIESMQEMTQFHVDYYLNLFDSVAVDGATIYISNAHDYYFRGAFNYAKNWKKVFCENTPRSWRPDHPTEIFVKEGL
jgi:SAM-dependent methyltransferase